ncbi:MAG TPA: DUF2889 domain-containing protein [Desulfomonilaceae bacterium]|nr:DUF2889 domain-containing protein [Desulfomonilaceae bacterium]
MLAYSRAKSIGVQRQGDDRRVASGVLEDELYAMHCEIVVNWPSQIIESIQTRMKRFTTTRCPLALPVFAKAEGWKLDAELDGKIRRTLGREGCRHMAGLIVDCCRSIARGELARELREALAGSPDLDRSAFVDDFCSRYPGISAYLRLR